MDGVLTLKKNSARLLAFFWIFFGGVYGFAQTHKGISFQGTVKLPSGEYPTRSGLTVIGQILSPNNCVLREEQFSGVNVSNGYINITIGSGSLIGADPGFTLKQVMDNSKVATGLTCLNSDGTINAGVTSFNPSTTNGARKFRLSVTIDSYPIVADFNMRAMAYAVNSESLNGKTETDFINLSTNITQSSVESWFASAVMGQLLAGTYVATTATTAGNVSGTVAVANGGTGATTAAGAVANLLPAQTGNGSKFLTTDGTNVSWAVIPSAPVTSVAGRSGDVLLTSADISDFSTAADARITAQKGQANGLASLNASGKVPSSQLALTAADIPSLDASKITTGTIDPSLLPASAGLWQEGASSIAYYNAGNVGIGTSSPTANLHVESSSGAAVFKLKATDASVNDASVMIDRPAARTGRVLFSTSGTTRWTLNADAAAESGANTGTNFALYRFNDAGTYIDTPFYIARFTGNVGIGNTSPGAKLDVTGQVKITGGSPGAGKVLTSDAAGLATWQALPAGNAGTVTGVTSGNNYLTVTNGSVAPVITANVGTAANTLAAGDDSRFTDARAPTGTAGGDLSGTYPNPTVAKINGNAVASTTPTAGQVMIWSAGNYAPVNFGIGNLLSATGAQQFANSSCTAAQTLNWSSLTDTFSCVSIAGLNASVITAGTIDSARLPASATAWVDGGSGTLYYNGGNVGVGTSTPSVAFEVNAPVTAAFAAQMKVTDGTTGGFWSLSDGTSTVGAYLPTYEFSSAGVSGFGGAIVGRIPDANDTLQANSAAVVIDGRTTTGTVANANLFAVRNYGSSALTVKANGYTGIGTTTPTAKLEVSGADYYGAVGNSLSDVGGIRVSGSANDFGGLTIWDRDNSAATTNDGDTTLYFGDDSADNLRIAYKQSGSAMAELARITSDGKFGIGTTTPNSKFEILSNSSSNQLRLSRSDNTNQTTGMALYPAGTLSSTNLAWTNEVTAGSALYQIKAYDGTLSVPRMTIGTNGFVGFGTGSYTTDPIAPLSVDNAIVNSASSTWVSGYKVGWSNDIGSGGSPQFVLLFPYYNGSITTPAGFSGILRCMRGTVAAFNLINEWEVSAQTAYDKTIGNIRPRNAYTSSIKLYKVTYSGTPYLAVRTSEISGSSCTVSLEGQYWNTINSQKPAFVLESAVTIDATHSAFDFLAKGIYHSGGSIGIATSTPAARLDVSDTSTTTSAIIVPRAATFTGTAVNGMVRYNTDTNLFQFYQNGSWVAYTTVSDGRLKTNVEPVVRGLDIVNQLNPVFYDWDKNNPRTQSYGDKHEVGFIAQEVEKVLPEVVDRGEDSYRSLQYGKMVAVVVAAVKELYKEVTGIKADSEAKIKQLEQANAKLEKENREIKARLDRIEKALQ